MRLLKLKLQLNYFKQTQNYFVMNTNNHHLLTDDFNLQVRAHGGDVKAVLDSWPANKVARIKNVATNRPQSVQRYACKIFGDLNTDYISLINGYKLEQ